MEKYPEKHEKLVGQPDFGPPNNFLIFPRKKFGGVWEHLAFRWRQNGQKKLKFLYRSLISDHFFRSDSPCEEFGEKYGGALFSFDSDSLPFAVNGWSKAVFFPRPPRINEISDFMKISKMQRTERFRTAPLSVERGAEMGSARTIGELPRENFPPIFPPDPTSEIGKIWKHYEFPRFSDPVLPVLQWGNCWSLKSTNSGF